MKIIVRFRGRSNLSHGIEHEVQVCLEVPEGAPVTDEWILANTADSFDGLISWKILEDSK